MNQVLHRPDSGLPAAEIEKLLLETVRRYLQESQASPPDMVDLDSALDTDLGLDSLGRVELISRLERSFNVSLPDYLAPQAQTPRDLLRAIRSAPSLPPQPPAIAEAVAVETTAFKPPPREITPKLPLGAKTLSEVLAWQVQQHPDRPHLQICNNHEADTPLTYNELYQHAKTITAGLQALNVQPGESVSIMLPTGKDYFFSFFGVLLAGAIPVPLYPPANPAQLEDHMRRHVSILNNCQSPVLITIPQAKKIARLLQSQVTALHHVTTVEALCAHSQAYSELTMTPDATAFIQYTSGSTGNPKGVVLSHANLLANIQAMGHAVKASSEDVFVSWLPLYHDMGLIGAWLGSLYYGYFLAVMSPLTFLRHPEKWLWTIHQYKGTLSASPNFGYELCIRRINEQALEGLNLSSWRAAFNGAETVSPSTMERFYEKFRPYGFRRQALMPVYGLAENSLGLAFSPLDRGMRVDYIKRSQFMREGKGVPAEPGDRNTLQFVSNGYPIKHHQIRIVDSGNRELPERQEGSLQFRGPSSTSGYYRNPEATKRLFHDQWLDSGDLAYIANGEVYLTGRVKDVIIRAGRNIYPHELEECVGEIQGIRAGRVTAFGSTDPRTGTERLVIVAETRETNEKQLHKLRHQVNSTVTNLTGRPPDEIVLAPPNTILKTSSGKLRRAASRELFEQGRIGKRRKPAWMQVLHFAARGFSSELRKSRNSIARLTFGFYARMLFWVLAVQTWTTVVALPSLPKRWSAIKKSTSWLANLTGTPVKVYGLENLPGENQACIYVSNHASYLDGPIIIHVLPRIVRFVAKAELKQQRTSRWFLNSIETEYVERFDVEKSLEDLNKLCASAQKPHGLFFFPEGTFVRRPGILPFRLGAFMVAAKTNLPVVPITIRGTRSILRAETWLPNRGVIHVYIGEPIDPGKISKTAATEDPWNTAKLLRDAARLQILKNSGEPDLRQ